MNLPLTSESMSEPRVKGFFDDVRELANIGVVLALSSSFHGTRFGDPFEKRRVKWMPFGDTTVTLAHLALSRCRTWLTTPASPGLGGDAVLESNQSMPLSEVSKNTQISVQLHDAVLQIWLSHTF